jgi:hypothetical protein
MVQNTTAETNSNRSSLRYSEELAISETSAWYWNWKCQLLTEVEQAEGAEAARDHGSDVQRNRRLQ